MTHYSKALEWAINHFHNERMRHINDIIGDLWTQIYAGNDIDTIKIVNDEESSKGDEIFCERNYKNMTTSLILSSSTVCGSIEK